MTFLKKGFDQILNENDINIISQKIMLIYDMMLDDIKESI